jgi:hypothetical protein
MISGPQQEQKRQKRQEHQAKDFVLATGVLLSPWPTMG